MNRIFGFGTLVFIISILWNRIKINPKHIEIDDVTVDVNHHLTDSLHLFNGQLYAPEEIIKGFNNTFFASLGDGQIVQIDSNFESFKPFGRTGIENPLPAYCGRLEHEPQCGRPLGLLFVKLKHFSRYLPKDYSIKHNEMALLVADAYLGLILFLEDKTKIFLLSTVNGKPLHFANSIEMSEDGRIYLTDSSSKFQRNRVLLEFLDSNANGRIIEFDPKSDSSRELVSSVEFPNGLFLKGDELYFVSTTRYSLMKLNLKSNEMSRVALLGGVPDNVSFEWIPQLNQSALIIGMSTKRSAVTSLLNQYPLLRIMISMLPYKVIPLLFKPFGMVSIIDLDGNLILNLFDPNGKTSYISGGIVNDNNLFLGSWKNNFIAKVDFSKINI
jgi:hypothetical protein